VHILVCQGKEEQQQMKGEMKNGKRKKKRKEKNFSFFFSLPISLSPPTHYHPPFFTRPRGINPTYRIMLDQGKNAFVEA
jgi:hypothetical protein